MKIGFFWLGRARGTACCKRCRRLVMPPSFRMGGITSPNALVADLQSSNIRLRLDNAALRRKCDSLRVESAESITEAEDIARRLRDLADAADEHVAALKAGKAKVAHHTACKHFSPPPMARIISQEDRAAASASRDSMPAGGRGVDQPRGPPEAAAPSLPLETSSPEHASASTWPSPSTLAPTADVLLSTAAPLRSVAHRIVAPIRGSYLIERWKQESLKGGARLEPLARHALPARAFWTEAELARLATLLSDAFDEHGQPAWGLLAAFKPRAAVANSGDPPRENGNKHPAKAAPMVHVFAATALPMPSGCSGPPPPVKVS